MAIKYDEVVPWGRNYDEYCRMFDLTPADLKKRILGCGDGPASFYHTCNMNGGDVVVSPSPIYALSINLMIVDEKIKLMGCVTKQ